MRAVTLDKASPFLHEQASAVCDDVFGRRVFVRGVVEVSRERVLTAIAAAGCEVRRVGIAEHLGRRNHLANGRGSHSSEATSRAFEVARSGPCL